jgi:hypothetical protein
METVDVGPPTSAFFATLLAKQLFSTQSTKSVSALRAAVQTLRLPST